MKGLRMGLEEVLGEQTGLLFYFIYFQQKFITTIVNSQILDSTFLMSSYITVNRGRGKAREPILST